MILTTKVSSDSLKPPVCNPLDRNSVCEKVSGGKSGLLFIGLYLIVLGNGCVKASLPAFGAEQFDPQETRKISTFFNFCFSSQSAGAAVGLTLVVWVMNNKGWDVGFGITAASIFLGILSVTAGFRTYRIRIPGGSPLTGIAKVRRLYNPYCDFKYSRF